MRHAARSPGALEPRKRELTMTDVVMPQMGESIVEGTLTKWLKKPGERIERDEPLFEISTDKVDTEIPSPGAGTLQEVLIEEGKTVAINTIVARIDEGAGASTSAETSPQHATEAATIPVENTVAPAPAAAEPVKAAPSGAGAYPSVPEPQAASQGQQFEEP